MPRSARRYNRVAGIDPIAMDEAGTRRVTAMIPDGLADTSEVGDLLDALRTVEVTANSTAATPDDGYSES